MELGDQPEGPHVWRDSGVLSAWRGVVQRSFPSQVELELCYSLSMQLGPWQIASPLHASVSPTMIRG